MKMNKKIIYLIGVLCLISIGNAIDISSCPGQFYSNEQYFFTADIGGIWCFYNYEVSGWTENVSIDCQGHTFSSASYGAGGFAGAIHFYSPVRNFTLKNCHLVDTGAAGQSAIIVSIDPVEDIYIYNHTYTATHDQRFGFYMTNSESSGEILFHNIVAEPISETLVWPLGDSDLEIINVSIKSTVGGTYNYGLGVIGNSIYIHNYTAEDIGTGVRLFQVGEPRDYRMNDFFIDNCSYGLYFDDATNILIQNGVIFNSTIGDILFNFDSTYENGYEKNNSIINVSYDNIQIQGDNKITQYWYYKAYVESTLNNPINNARLMFRDVNNIFVKKKVTDGTGYTEKFLLPEWKYDNGEMYEYSNYTVKVFHKNYSNFTSREFNLSDNMLDEVFTLDKWDYTAMYRPVSKFFTEGGTNNFTFRPISSKFTEAGTNNFSFRTTTRDKWRVMV